MNVKKTTITSANESISKRIRLVDGRWLGYAEFGDLEGKPVFYFHGWPSSRLDYLVADPDGIALRLGIRIIAPDRPGFGLSDLKPARQLMDWSDDVTELADALDVGRFAVLGYSGGTPFALACAFKIPERVTATSIVAVASPFNVPGAINGMARSIRIQYFLARRLPILYRLMSKQITPERIIASPLKTLPEPDAAVRSRPEIIQRLVDAILESRRSGLKGATQEGSILSSDWRLPLEKIAIRVNLWHGKLDEHYPITMARYIASMIPDSRLNNLTEEGHSSIIVNCLEEILGDLVA